MPDAALRIVVWNVEHGNAIYANTPNGRSIVMDAGSSDNFSPAAWLKQFYGVEHAHHFLLSHADSDHIRDIKNVHRLLQPCVFSRNTTVPRDLIYPTYPPEADPLRYYFEFDNLYSSPLPDYSSYKLQQESNWGGVKIDCFFNQWPQVQLGKTNDYSLVVILRYGNLKFLFPGDLESPGWEALMNNIDFLIMSLPETKEEVRILVASHHGRKAGVHHPFLNWFQPHLSLVSDVYGSPYTDYATYIKASIGYSVYDSKNQKSEEHYVVSTKTNDSIFIHASPSLVWVAT